jgi:hypothetical protein
MKRKTHQEIFNTVAAHLLKQGGQATNKHGRCKYRTPEGSQCAIGCLIPADKYHRRIEGIPVNHSGVLEALQGVIDVQCVETLQLLDSLQRMHDAGYSWSGPCDIRRALNKVASSYNLKKV